MILHIDQKERHIPLAKSSKVLDSNTSCWETIKDASTKSTDTSFFTQYVRKRTVSQICSGIRVDKDKMDIPASPARIAVSPHKNIQDKLETIFPKDKWKAVSQVEKLYADGDAMPRLAFFANNVRDQIYIHINRIECHFYEYAAEQKRLLCKLIHFAETECNTRFCHMSLETNADLGVVMNKRILSQTHFHEERTCRRGDLFEHQFLEVDYKLVPSPFDIQFASRNWHYGIRLFTPDNEHTTWYDGDTVISFFDDAANSNLARIEYLMKGSVYGKYQKIR